MGEASLRDRASGVVTIVPIFILSLPRSGSTLVQRVLGALDGVATASEPWVALPVLSSLGAPAPTTSAWDTMVREAVHDFARELPGGEADLLEASRDYLLDLYRRAGGPDARWFVDKTPPYFMILDQLFRAFPDGRFVFLWRNPLSVIASATTTFSAGRWDMHARRGDLFYGLAQLCAAYERHRDRAVCVRYEDLVADGTDGWSGLARDLGLPFSADALQRFADVPLSGRMGDVTGRRRFQEISTQPLDAWRDVINNPLRKEWCRRYLRWVGARRLALMGYELDALLTELDAIDPGRERLLDDAGLALRSVVAEALAGAVGGHHAPSQWRALARGEERADGRRATARASSSASPPGQT
jgi:sulfotransferase family protein